MSTGRMDEGAFRLIYWRQVDNGPEASDVANEAARARSEEARLLEENRTQAEQIKALADALERSARWLGWNDETPCWCEDAHQHETAQRQDCKLNTAALRLCGRIP